MHLHLDLTGGIAGDMFAAAMLDTFPTLQAPLFSCLEALGERYGFAVSLSRDSRKGIAGNRFDVRLNHNPHGHLHHHWHDIRAQLQSCDLLEESVRHTAVGIFSHLASAEAQVHGVEIEAVAFHEVGAWDCIADIVSAAWLIEHSGVRSWSVSRLPWGGGTIDCAHGLIPVPAPATLQLLKGFQFFDDGEPGERITPTGAAILRWLAPSQTAVGGELTAVGHGLGGRDLAHTPNLLRISAFSTVNTAQSPENLLIIQCDIDDMSGELLAIARDNLRAQPGVLEITENTAMGKKNRFISTLTLLCQPQQQQSIIEAVFTQTSTLGVRYWPCERVTLPRQHQQLEGHSIKTAQRPGGITTAKLEADELVALSSLQQRHKLKRTLEQRAEEVDEHSAED